MGSLSDPCDRETLEHRIQAGIAARRLGTALAGYALRLPAPSGIIWDRELARLPPEAAVRLLMRRWAPAGWAVCFIVEPGCALIWHARHKPSMDLGDYLHAIDPLDLHEQMEVYPARRVTMEL